MPGPNENKLLSQLAERASGDAFWSEFFDNDRIRYGTWTLHVAIFQEPYLSYVLQGRKRVESRFSQHQVAPFGAVGEGDVVALKRAAGPIVGICLINAVWSYRLDKRAWSEIKDRFAPLLCVEGDDFWASRSAARFATLLSLHHVLPIAEIDYRKRDRRGWVVERNRVEQIRMDLLW